MPEDRKTDQPENVSSAAPVPEMPLDTRLLSYSVIELNISLKNVAIYPSGHAQITRSIDNAFEILMRLFEIRPEMTFGVAKDTLLIGKDYLDRKNPVYRDFALSLNQQGIAAVTFSRGLSREELVRFHQVLSAKPDDIRARGGIKKVMEDSSIAHVSVTAIDYGSFHVTDEQEIMSPRKQTGGEKGSDVWQDFVAHLSDNTLAVQGEGTSLNRAERIDPVELARLLNERKLDPGAAVQSYDRIITSHIRSNAERKQLTHEQSKTLEGLNTLIRELNPDLRKQFLSVAFQRVSENASLPAAGDIIGGFADDAVVEMLAQANAEGRQISPTLTGIIGQLAGTRPDGAAAGPAGSAGTMRSTRSSTDPEILPEEMEKLFEREHYEDYVPDAYQAMLDQVKQPVTGAAASFPLEEHLKSLDDSRLDSQIGRALIAFLDENLEEDDYREFVKKLTAIVPGFLETGNFELLWDISETLRRHTTDKPVKAIREAAEEARGIFTDPSFIEKALHAFEVWMRDKGQEAAGLIMALGPDTIPGLMDIFSRDESHGGKRVLFNLLCLFGESAVREAQKRLRDPRSYYVINLLIFIRRAGTPASVPHVRPLLKHQDLFVRMEALSTLLKFKDPDSVKLLREAIRSDDVDIASKAVSLAGLYRVSEVTEDVLARLKRVILFDTDYTVNAEIIKALGDIGDPRAVPDLEKLARANWSLYPQSLLWMKEILFESLGRYPREKINNLINIGEQLNSDKIRKACRKLADRT